MDQFLEDQAGVLTEDLEEEAEGGRTFQGLTDGRRLDVQLSELSGLSRSRVASLMEDGCVRPAHARRPV